MSKSTYPAELLKLLSTDSVDSIQLNLDKLEWIIENQEFLHV